MAKFYKNPFAYNGDFEPIADGTQSNGKISNEDGFTSDYELLKSDPNYRPVGRKEMNGIFNEITGALHQIQTQGAAELEFNFDGYKKGAIVRCDGNLYLLTSDTYTDDEGPESQPETWLRLDILSENRTVTVGTGGDFIDIWDAMYHYARLLIVRGEARLEINLLPGYVLTYQTLLDGLDLGFVDITSSGTIEVRSSSMNMLLGPGCKPAFGAKNGGVLPVITAKFQFTNDTDREKHGVAVLSGSKAVIGTGGGFLNTPGASLYADGLGSEIVAKSGYDASNSYYGISAQNMAKVQADGMTADSCGDCAIYAERQAIVYAHGATLTKAGGTAIYARNGAQVWADYSNLSETDVGGAYAEIGSTISINQASILLAGYNGISCYTNSYVFAQGVKISSAGDFAIFAGTGGHVAAQSAEITDCATAMEVTTGGKVDARGATISNTQKIEAEDGGEVIIDEATIFSPGSSFEINADAAKISANEASIQVGENESCDISILHGAEIRLCGAHLYTDGSAVSFYLPQTENVPTTHGIIWM